MEKINKTRSWLGFLCGSDSKESACNARNPGSIHGSGQPPGEGNGYPLMKLNKFDNQTHQEKKGKDSNH